MGIQSFDPEEIVRYVPRWGNNHKDPNPCVVGIKPVNHARWQEYTHYLAEKLTAGDVPLNQAAARRVVEEKQFVESVAFVENYSVGDREVKTAKELYHTADRQLIEEILAATEKFPILDAGQEKNLKRVSDGPSGPAGTGAPSSATPASPETETPETAATDKDSAKTPAQ